MGNASVGKGRLKAVASLTGPCCALVPFPRPFWATNSDPNREKAELGLPEAKPLLGALWLVAPTSVCVCWWAYAPS